MERVKTAMEHFETKSKYPYLLTREQATILFSYNQVKDNSY